MTGIDETWTNRDLPILAAALRRLDRGEDFLDFEAIREETGLTTRDLRVGLKALEGAFPPYIETEWLMGWTEEHASGFVTGVSERARRELGSWPTPTSVVDQIVESLAAAADAETEPERKGRLRSAAETLGGVARDVAVAVLSAKLGSVT
jgi:hypothetical protein